MKSDSRSELPPSPLPPALVELARAHANGDAGPRVHLASRVRVIEQLTTSGERRPRSWLSVGPVVAGAGAVLLVMLGIHFGARRSEPLAESASAVVSAVAPPSAVVALSAPNDQVVATLRPAFRKCYQHGLATDPTMEGRVVISATVEPDGVVRTASVLEREGLSVEVGACLTAVVQAAKFEATGGVTTIKIPVAFSTSKPPTSTAR